MHTRVDEIAERIYRLSTCVPDAAPGGFTFNQFLVDADEPLLFHTGPRRMFPLVSQAIAGILPLARLRWITFGHVESDECGAMNEFLAAAPHAQVAHGTILDSVVERARVCGWDAGWQGATTRGSATRKEEQRGQTASQPCNRACSTAESRMIGCMVSLDDLCDRPPRRLADGEVIDLGGRRVRNIDTPHVPHNWEARVLFEETTGTLFCGDLFTHTGDGPALTEADIVGPAMAAEAMFHATSLSPATAPTIRRLAALEPRVLALMHGSSTRVRCGESLVRLAEAYEGMGRVG